MDARVNCRAAWKKRQEIEIALKSRADPPVLGCLPDY
jgi:hypothetical protein